MTQLLEIVQRLTDAELREVRDFAEFLLTRRTLDATGDPSAEGSHKISFDGWAGSLANVHPELSDEGFNRLILNEWERAGGD